MKRAAVAELKASLSRYLAAVKAGEEILVTERGRAVARLVPVSETQRPRVISDLIRAGILRPPLETPTSSSWKTPRVRDPEASVRKALLADREEGR